nr:hypothetical protein [Tanacetum cinerariifolium]
GQVLHEEELEFLADPGIAEDQSTQFDNLAEVHNLDNVSNNKEESRNIDRELALEKQVEELNNIVFKRNQSAQTVHMLTKPQFFYDHSTRQALAFQNPCYLKKAQQLEPKHYDGRVIQKTNAIMIRDSKETLMLEDESRSKMIQKQKDPMMSEKKVNTNPNSVNSEEPNLSTRPTIVEVPKEFPKVSMVNSSLKKLKFHLTIFDVVVKERTTATAITEGYLDNDFQQWHHEPSRIAFACTYEALYDAQNEVACLMLGSMSPDLERALENYKAYDMIQELKSMFEEQAKQELFETVKAFHACKQEDGQSNYNMHIMGKSIVELHAMLKLHKKGILKKAKTPAMLAIWEGKIQKDKKKPQGAKGKEKGKNKLTYAPKPKILPPPKRDNLAKDSVCHHCKEVGHWKRNCPSYQTKLTKRKNASIASTLDNVFYFNAIPCDGIYEIDRHNLYPNVSSMFNVSNKRAKYALDSSYLWHCRLSHINKEHMDKLRRDRILQVTHDESLEKCKSCIFGKMVRKPFPHQVERAKDLLGLIHTDGYALESAVYSLNIVPTTKVERSPYEIWYGKDPKLSCLRV